MRSFKYIFGFLLPFVILSCEELLFEEDISEKIVTLVAPGSNAEIQGNSVRFNWESMEGASNFEIQIATPNFANANQLVLSNITDSTFYQIELIENNYEWRVRAKNSGYVTAFASANFKVVPIENFSNNSVILLSPTNGLMTNEDSFDLKWEAIPEATQYRVQILDTNGEPIQSETTTETTLNMVFPEGNLKWQVRAEKHRDYTLYSSRNMTVDRTNPNSPILLTPTDEEDLITPMVTFDWKRNLIDGSVEFDSIYIYRNLNLTDLVLKDRVIAPFETTLENDNTYYWYIKAFDEAGNESDDSDVFSFTIDE